MIDSKKFKATSKDSQTKSNSLDINDPWFLINFELKALPNYTCNVWDSNQKREYQLIQRGTHSNFISKKDK